MGMSKEKLAAYEEFEKRVEKLSRSQRAALSAVCAERVLPLVENHFGSREPFQKAINLIWDFALGKNVNENMVSQVLTDCKAIISGLYDDGESGSLIFAVGATFNALKAIQNPTSTKEAFRAIIDASDAANADSDDGDANIAEEEIWQNTALSLVEANQTVSQGMFDSINQDPNWLKRYRNSDEWIER